MFTDPNQLTENEPRISIGEVLDGPTHYRTDSNPFQLSSEQDRWEEEKRLMSNQMRLMTEQLDSEKVARIESQVRCFFVVFSSI